MIKGEASTGGINDLIHWPEGDISTFILPLMCDLKAAFSTTLATLVSLEQ